MRIHSFSKILAFPFGLIFIIVLYLTMEFDNMTLSYWLIPPAMVLTLIFVFSPQIDYWWYKDHPPGLDKPIVSWLEKHSKYYKALSHRNKQRFRDRLSVAIRTSDFSTMAPERTDMPEDLKAIVASNLIQLTFGMEKYLLRHFVRIVLYHHAFPSPDQPKLHTMEVNTEDGVILLSLEHALPGMLQTSKFYNIALHAFILAHLHENPIPASIGAELESTQDHLLEEISGLKFDRIKKIIGLPHVDKRAAVIHHFFQYRVEFLQKLPGIYKLLAGFYSEPES